MTYIDSVRSYVKPSEVQNRYTWAFTQKIRSAVKVLPDGLSKFPTVATTPSCPNRYGKICLCSVNCDGSAVRS